MKVSFIYLPHPFLKQPDAQAPLGLLYLATVARRRHSVNVLNLSSKTVKDSIECLEYADIFGITATCLEVPQANEFAKLIKEKFEGSKVIIGGPGTIAGEYINFKYVDSICRGEAEGILKEILSDAEKNDLKKIYIGKPGSIENIEPSRDMLDFQGGNIFAFNKQHRNGQSTILSTSRGCPYNCAYCAAPNLGYGKVRYRSPKSVAAEVKGVIKDFGITQFRISDDMFTSSRKRVFEICDELGSLDIAWRISTRVKPADEELFRAMYDAGCVEVSFGVESFDDDVLKILNKNTTAKDNINALEVANKVGMTTRVLFMIRTPGQNKQTVARNIHWLERVPYDIICCTTFVPLPGSDIWASPRDYGIDIIDRNLSHYNFYFFDANGEVELNDVISFRDRDTSEVNAETAYFKEYLKSTGKLNKG